MPRVVAKEHDPESAEAGLRKAHPQPDEAPTPGANVSGRPDPEGEVIDPKKSRALFVGAAPEQPAEPEDENSTKFRQVFGATPATAEADLEKALTVGAAHPTPFPQARAERIRAEREARAEEMSGRSTRSAEDAVNVLAPETTDQNRADRIRSSEARYGTVGTIWVESRSDESVKYLVSKNVSDDTITIKLSDAEGDIALCPPGSWYGHNPANGSFIVLDNETIHNDYRPARRSPTGRLVP